MCVGGKRAGEWWDLALGQATHRQRVWRCETINICDGVFRDSAAGVYCGECLVTALGGP